MKESKINNKINKQNDDDLEYIQLQQDINKTKIQEDIDKITFIPKEFIPSVTPKPYEKSMNGINEINRAYSLTEPPISVLGLNYADVKISELRKTPQYKNKYLSNKNREISNDLIDNNTGTTSNNIVNNYSSGGDNSNSISNSISNSNNKVNSDLFRNPKREFLDSEWLQIKQNTYNDVCTSCTTSNKGNAICTVPKYGEGLEECTNQTDSVNNSQLINISSNKIEPIYKF
jgi:hypothetical protein